MKTTKEKADELVKQFYYHEFDKVKTHEATIHAINAVKHTIETLQLALDNQAMYNDDYNVLEQLEYQQLLLKELESRL